MNNKSMTDKFEKFAEGKDIGSQEDFKRTFDEFMKIQKIIPFNNSSEKEAEDAYDYLELSDAAPNKKPALKYDEMSGIGYRPFTIEEFLIEMQENGYLFAGTPQYVLWESRKLKL